MLVLLINLANAAIAGMYRTFNIICGVLKCIILMDLFAANRVDFLNWNAFDSSEWIYTYDTAFSEGNLDLCNCSSYPAGSIASHSIVQTSPAYSLSFDLKINTCGNSTTVGTMFQILWIPGRYENEIFVILFNLNLAIPKDLMLILVLTKHCVCRSAQFLILNCKFHFGLMVCVHDSTKY